MFSCELCEISKNTFFYRTTPMTASDILCLRDNFIKTDWFSQFSSLFMVFKKIEASVYLPAQS